MSVVPYVVQAQNTGNSIEQIYKDTDRDNFMSL